MKTEEDRMYIKRSFQRSAGGGGCIVFRLKRLHDMTIEHQMKAAAAAAAPAAPAAAPAVAAHDAATAADAVPDAAADLVPLRCIFV